MNNRRELTIEGLESRWQRDGRRCWTKPSWWWKSPEDFSSLEEQVLARTLFNLYDKADLDDPLQRIAVWKLVVRMNRLVQETTK